jgi:hypothetical protein
VRLDDIRNGPAGRPGDPSAHAGELDRESGPVCFVNAGCSSHHLPREKKLPALKMLGQLERVMNFSAVTDVV